MKFDRQRWTEFDGQMLTANRVSSKGGRMLFRVATVAMLLAWHTAKAGQIELLSITGIELPEGSYVAGFNVDTWGVEVLAVCRFPFGWTLTAGKSADPSGTLKGEASLGVTLLNRRSISELRNLFLVDIDGYQAETRFEGNTEYPATFIGTITVGKYGDDSDPRAFPLSSTNFVRTAATRCPEIKISN
jgi:hypothetical protein